MRKREREEGRKNEDSILLAELCKTYLSHDGLTTDDDIFSHALSHTRVRMECSQVHMTGLKASTQLYTRATVSRCECGCKGVCEVRVLHSPSISACFAADVRTHFTSTLGTVKDVAVSSATGAVNTHVPLYFPLETGSARFLLILIPRSEGRFNSQMV